MRQRNQFYLEHRQKHGRGGSIYLLDQYAERKGFVAGDNGRIGQSSVHLEDCGLLVWIWDRALSEEAFLSRLLTRLLKLLLSSSKGLLIRTWWPRRFDREELDVDLLSTKLVHASHLLCSFVDVHIGCSLGRIWA
jgi:hypothetical protein